MVFWGIQIRGNVGYSGYIFDLENYLNIADSFFADGFSLVRGKASAAGYAYPVLLGLSHFIDVKLGQEIYLFRLISSVIYGSAVMILVCTYERFFGDKSGKHFKQLCIGCIAVIMMLYLFYRGIIFFPLSDLFAASLAIISGSLALNSLKTENNVSLVWVLGSGFFAYLAYNTRSVYIITLIVTPVFLFINQRGCWRKNIEVVLFFLLGMIIAALPWIYMNYSIYNRITIGVNNENRYANQLFWGLEYTRYVAFTGLDPDIQIGGVRFINLTGKKLVDIYKSCISDNYTLLGYVKLVLKYPVEIVSIMGQHVINVMFPLFPEQYTGDLHKSRLLNGLLGIAYWYLFALIIAWKMKNKRVTVQQLAWFILMIAPSVLTLPGAGEHRFYLMLYMSVCAVIAFAIQERSFWHFLTDKMTLVIGMGILFAIIVFTVETNVLASCEYYPILWVKNI